MNQAVPSQLHLSENGWRGIILVLSCAAILVTIWSLTHEFTSLFLQLYYFPMVLLTYRYRWKGFGFAILLGLIYLGLVIVLNAGQTDAIIGALARFLVFVGISAVIAYLADRLATSKSTVQQSAEIKDRYLSLAPAIILVLDRNGAITYLNKKGGEILQCLPDEISGKIWADLFLPEKERGRVKKIFSELITGQVEQNRVFENAVLTSGGIEKIIRWYNSVLHDENGAITGTLGFGEDITEEKWAQDTLREMQEFQESVITNANVWISVLEPDGTLLVWNDAAEAISGYKKTGVLGKKTIWKQLYPDKEYRKKVTGEIRRIIGRDTYLEDFETDIHCADGTKKTIVWNSRGLRDNNGAITSYIAIGRDVTAQKSAESRAVESSRFLATMINTLPIPIFFKDTAGKYLGCNPPYEEYIGIKSDSLIGKTAYDVSPKDLADKYTAADRRVFDNPVPQRCETQVQHADGTRHDVIFYKAPFLNKDGSLGGLIGTFLDITDRKRIEEALKESESFNRGLVENLPDYVAVYDMDGKLLYINPSSARGLGYDADTLVGTHVLSYVAKEYHETVIANMTARKKGGETSPYEIEMVTKNGSRRTVIVKATAIQYHNNPAILLLLIDITDRKKAEEAIQRTGREWQTTFDAINDIVYLLDEKGRIVRHNRAFETFTNKPADEIDGRLCHEVLHGTSLPIAECPNVQAQVSRQRESVEMNIDGRWFEAIVDPIIDKNGSVSGAVHLITDISERKTSEEALALDKQRMESLLSLSQMSQMADAEIISEVVENAIRLTGSTIGYLATMNDDESVMTMQYWSKTAHVSCNIIDKPIVYNVEDTGLWGEAVRQRKPMITNDYTAESPYKRGTPKGHVPLVRHMNIPVFEGDRIVAVAGVGNKGSDYNEGDIRQMKLLMQGWWQTVIRKREEEEIRLSNVILKTQQETSPDGILIVDKSGKILSFNHRFTEIWGIPRDVLDSRSDERALSYVLDKLTDPEEFLARVKNLYEHQKEKSREEILLRDGHMLERYSAPMLGEDNQYFGRIWYFHDITDSKQMEKQISESRELFADIISFLPDPTFVIDKEGKVLAWNRAIEQLSGVPAHDIIGKGDHEYSLWMSGKRRPIFIDLVLHPDQDYARMNYTGIQMDGQTVTGQYNVVLPDGRKTVLSLVASPLFDVQGNIVGAIESIRDITRIKDTEAELARLNENLETIVKDRTRLLEDEVVQRIRAEKDVQTALDYTRSVIEANPDLMVVLDAKGKILDINAAGELLTGIPKEKLIGSSYFGYLVDDGTHFNKFSSLLHEGKLENFVELRRNDGHITPLSVHAIGIRGDDGKFDRFIVAAHDITRQKRDEEAIRASLEEKVVLLREVHHRVKNNLQIIISLVNLQMRQTDDPTVKQIMSETQNRVRAMSLVHEKLYRSESLSKIDFADYTRFLATQLFSFYGTDSRRVRLEFAMSKIMVDINTAVPLGLLMNELISNSLKHAFPKGMAGAISISGGYEGERMMLVVRDNGIGIPPDFDWKNTTSLGMRLVISLIDQVDGTIELDRKNGTTFTITVKRDRSNEGAE
ncbi:MAG: PAS domain S-box protein [Methanoregula sp.]